MKLLFDKNESGETFLRIEGKEFATKDYIKMVRAVKSGIPIEVECGQKMSEEEKVSVKEMVKQINGIGKDETEDFLSKEYKEDDLPF